MQVTWPLQDFFFFFFFLHNFFQVVQMSILTYVIVISVPSVLAIMNLVWFLKIVRGVKKTLAKRQWSDHIWMCCTGCWYLQSGLQCTTPLALRKLHGSIWFNLLLNSSSNIPQICIFLFDINFRWTMNITLLSYPSKVPKCLVCTPTLNSGSHVYPSPNGKGKWRFMGR